MVMVVYGGFRYLVGSGLGDVKRGKEIILDAIAGLIILLGAYVILANINPATLNLQTLHVNAVRPEQAELDDEAGRYNDVDGTIGPASLCRENLAHPNPHAWCAACGSVSCQMHPPATPDRACLALSGARGTALPCGRDFGLFLRAVTDGCVSKRFDWFDGLDGVTFGILHYTENDLPKLLHEFQGEDSAAYTRIFGTSGVTVSQQWFCTTNRESRGVACHEGFRNAMRQALREPAFTRVQAKNAFHAYQSRIRSSPFSSPYGKTVWATVLNNPGHCGAGFTSVLAACPASASEEARIRCFLDQYVTQGCRNGTASAESRRASILQNLSGAPLTGSSPITEAEMLGCIAHTP